MEASIKNQPSPQDGIYSSRIFKSYIRYLKNAYAGIDTRAILDHAGMSEFALNDQGCWFSQEQADRFQHKAEELTQNPDIAFDAGLAAFERHALGAAQNYVLSFLTPSQLLAQVEKTVNALTKTLTFTTNFPSKETAEVRVDFAPWAEEKPYQCRNRFGSIIAAVRSTGYHLVSYEHPECRFKGGECCRYLFQWQRPVEKKLSTLRNLVGIGLGTGWIYHCFSLSEFGFRLLALASIGFLAGACALESRARRKVEAKLAGIKDPTSQLIDQANSTYNNALVTKEIGQAIRLETNAADILEAVTGVMAKRLRYSFGIVLLYDQAKETLVYGSSYGFSPEVQQFMQNSAFFASKAREESKIWEAFRSQKSVALDNLSKNRPENPEVAQLNAALKIESFACTPIICDQEALGVMLVGYFYSDPDAAIRESDLTLLTGIAPVLGVTLRNAGLIQEKEIQHGEILALEQSRALIAKERDRAERLAEDLQLTNEELKAFAYIISHDLRAPLVNIRGFATELTTALREATPLLAPAIEQLEPGRRRELELLLQQDVPEAVGFINSSVQRMDGQINAILKLSRLGRREFKAEAVDLGPLVADLLKTLTHQLESRQATAEVGELPMLHSDRLALEQIFGNLLDNATKYLDPTRPGALRIEAELQETDWLIHVHDNGRGIAAEEMDKVFAPFRRAGKIDTQGEGMGLAYVRTLVRAIGGRIGCSSTFGVGTTFTLTFPARLILPPKA